VFENHAMCAWASTAAIPTPVASHGPAASPTPVASHGPTLGRVTCS
jgi:hypothetical protein